jgi:DNA-directed RNA polymerase III subunit RPC3
MLDQVRFFFSFDFISVLTILDPTPVANIAAQLSDDPNLTEGLVLSPPKKPSNMSLIEEYLGMSSSPTRAGRAALFTSFRSSKVQVEFWHR